MSLKHWSRQLLSLGLLSLALGALPAMADDEQGTQVVVRLANGGGEMPNAEKMVQSLTATGGKHQVEVKVRKTPEQQEATMKLWGRTVPPEAIAQTLRDAFPALATADIQVSTLDASERPRIEEGEGKRVRKIIKKEVHKD
jgi:ABC-type glycerol-3-phosphate transport system substrate-binding protein